MYIHAMAEKKYYYRYALDNEGKLIHISEVNESNRSDGYRCFSCGEELIPVLGKTNAHHFRHKTSICSYETYLHKLAKHTLKQKFDTLQEFEIVVPQNRLCINIQTCKFGHEDICSVKEHRKYDLKGRGQYDSCFEERPVLDGRFVADLLIESTKGNRKPLLIEFWVTHKSSEEKINSGLPIIEIHIENELQVEDLFSNPIGCQDAKYELEFYNFKKHSTSSCNPSDIRLPLSRFTVYNSGKSFLLSPMVYMDDANSFDCSKLNERKKNNTKIEIALFSHQDYHIPLYYCYKQGVNACYCSICQFSTESMNGLLCKLFNTRGTPHYPLQECIIDCKHFRLNEMQAAFLEEKLKETPLQELAENNSQTKMF